MGQRVAPVDGGNARRAKGALRGFTNFLSLVAVLRSTITMRLNPYDTTSRNTTFASAQVTMPTPNAHCLEIAHSELPYYNAALTPPLDVRNGFYHVSDRPGLGHELNPDYVAAGADRSLID